MHIHTSLSSTTWEVSQNMFQMSTRTFDPPMELKSRIKRQNQLDVCAYQPTFQR
jgi:hypothetical protein